MPGIDLRGGKDCKTMTIEQCKARLILQGIACAILVMALVLSPAAWADEAYGKPKVTAPQSAPQDASGDAGKNKAHVSQEDDEDARDGASLTVFEVIMGAVFVVVTVGAFLCVAIGIIALPWFYFIKPFIQGYRGDPGEG